MGLVRATVLRMWTVKAPGRAVVLIVRTRRTLWRRHNRARAMLARLRTGLRHHVLLVRATVLRMWTVKGPGRAVVLIVQTRRTLWRRHNRARAVLAKLRTGLLYHVLLGTATVLPRVLLRMLTV